MSSMRAVSVGWCVVVAVALACVVFTGPVHADAPPRRLAGAPFASAGLRGVRDAARPALGRLRRVAPGKRGVRDASGDVSPGGRTYRERAWRLGTGATIEARLAAVTNAMAHPDPDDEAWYSSAALLAAPDAATIASTFEIPDRAPPAAERQAVLALATRLAAALAARPSLAIYRVMCGWGDAVGAAYHGVVIVDRATDELLWLHVDESWSEG